MNLTRQYNHFTDPEAFTVSVKVVDEFTTKEDWDLIWDKYMRPRQEYLWEQRGMEPQGRRTADITRLKKAVPLYHAMVQESLEMKDMIARASVDWDQETIR